MLNWTSERLCHMYDNIKSPSSFLLYREIFGQAWQNLNPNSFKMCSFISMFLRNRASGRESLLNLIRFSAKIKQTRGAALWTHSQIVFDEWIYLPVRVQESIMQSNQPSIPNSHPPLRNRIYICISFNVQIWFRRPCVKNSSRCPPKSESLTHRNVVKKHLK